MPKKGGGSCSGGGGKKTGGGGGGGGGSKKSGGGGGGAHQANNNRSNQSNPNNPAYWTSRGESGKPANWSSAVEQNRQNGLLEHRANTAGAMSQGQRRAMHTDTRRVDKVVKKTLGGDAQVYYGGSIKKSTNIASSDLDLKVKVTNPVTKQQRKQLGKGFANEFGNDHVRSHNPKIHIVHGASGPIDVVPSKADYFPDTFKLDKPGVRPFTTNDIGRHAVRNLKLENPNVPGIKIERTVLATQQANRGIDLVDLTRKAGQKL